MQDLYLNPDSFEINVLDFVYRTERSLDDEGSMIGVPKTCLRFGYKVEITAPVLKCIAKYFTVRIMDMRTASANVRHIIDSNEFILAASACAGSRDVLPSILRIFNANIPREPFDEVLVNRYQELLSHPQAGKKKIVSNTTSTSSRSPRSHYPALRKVLFSMKHLL